MCLKRFVVYQSFGAWAPSDRGHSERRISISPGVKDVFTDDADHAGVFIKFLKNGTWYEAERDEFARSTRAEDRVSVAGV